MDELRFQPRVALSDGRVHGMEVLPPQTNDIPAAELGWCMVSDALSAMKLWADCGFSPYVWLPLPRGALGARALMDGYAVLNGVDEGRLLLADAPHQLTIDGAMLEQAAESRSARNALGVLLQKAHSAGMVSCAQGVSNFLHWEMLRELGCAYASGEFIAEQCLALDVPDGVCTWSKRHAAISAVYELDVGA